MQKRLFRSNFFPYVFWDNSDGKIFYERRIRSSKCKTNRTFIHRFGSNAKPVGAQGALILRVLDQSDGKNNVVGSEFFSIMPLNARTKSKRVRFPVVTNRVGFGKIKCSVTVARIHNEARENKPCNIAIGIIYGGIHGINDSWFSKHSLIIGAANFRNRNGKNRIRPQGRGTPTREHDQKKQCYKPPLFGRKTAKDIRQSPYFYCLPVLDKTFECVLSVHLLIVQKVFNR